MDALPDRRGGSSLWLRIRKAAYILVGGCVFGTVAFTVLFVSGARDVQEFCSKVTPGTTIGRLKSLAEGRGVTLKAIGVGTAPVPKLMAHNNRSYGRHTCMIEHDGQQVTKVTSSFLD